MKSYSIFEKKDITIDEFKELLRTKYKDNNVQYGTLLHYSTKYNRDDLVEILLKDFKTNPNIQDQDGWTSLYIACDNNNFKIAELLIKYNADPNLADNDSKITPLLIAASKANVELMKLLINNNAEVNINTLFGTPLHAAAKCNYTIPSKMAAIKLLIDNGADVYATDSFELTAKDYLMQDDLALGEEFDKLLSGNITNYINDLNDF